MARAFYSYDDRYMVTGTIRRDGYSAFGANNPYAWFPSGGIAWSFTNEDFFQKYTHIMNSGKLRVSYGKNGNRSLENPYEALANLYPGGGKMQGYIVSSGDLYLMLYLMAQRMKNPNLQWEKTQSWNFVPSRAAALNLPVGAAGWRALHRQGMEVPGKVTSARP